MHQEDIRKVIDSSISSYTGDARVLESAIGAFYLGFKIGWKPLRLMHSGATFSRYQRVLGVDFLEVFPEVGPLADKSLGWRIVKLAGNFWDAAKGIAPGRSGEFTN